VFVSVSGSGLVSVSGSVFVSVSGSVFVSVSGSVLVSVSGSVLVSVTKKTQLQRYLTKKYDVLEIAGIEKLVRKGTGVIYYCTIEELYRLIKTAHSTC
jgi:hypothetical protein